MTVALKPVRNIASRSSEHNDMYRYGIVAVFLAVTFSGYVSAAGVANAVTGAAEKSVVKKVAAESAERAAVKAGATAAAAKLPKHVVGSFRDGKYATRQLRENERFFHYHPEQRYAPPANEYIYLTNRQYSSPKAAVDDLALAVGDRAGFVTEFMVPKGTVVHEGVVSAAYGRPGGGMQFVVKDLSPNWAVSTRRVAP